MGQSAIADFNGDGFEDILVNIEDGTARLYLNDGTGNFNNYTSHFTPGSYFRFEAGDLDNDGDIDLVVTNDQSSLRVLLNSGAGAFSALPNATLNNGSGRITAAKIIDINRDGKNDIIWANGDHTANDSNQVWLNTGTTGNPAFSFSAAFPNEGIGENNSIDAGDIDGDNDIDIIVGGRSWNLGVFKNDGSGQFTKHQQINEYAGFSRLIDWDQDGNLDIINYDNYNNFGLRFRKNDGNGNFEISSTQLLWEQFTNEVVLADLNNDGFLDAVCDQWGGNGIIYINNGCHFTKDSGLILGPSAGIAIGDFNKDGRPDVFCKGRDAASGIFLNDINKATPVPLPKIISTQPGSGCKNESFILTAVSNGGTLHWFDQPSGGMEIFSGDTLFTPLIAVNTPFFVEAVNSIGCISNRITVNVTVSSKPDPDFIFSQDDNFAGKITFQPVTTSGVTYLWTFGDGNGSTASNPVHFYTSNGSYNIVLKVTNSLGCTDTISRTYNLTNVGIRGIETTDYKTNAFPNPFNDKLEVKYNLPANSTVRHEITDLSGRLLHSSTENMEQAGNHTVSIDNNGLKLKNGVYQLRLYINGQVITKKIIRTE